MAHTRNLGITLPEEEATALKVAAKKTGVSMTMYVRLWIRERLMGQPIQLVETVENVNKKPAKNN